MGLGVDGTETFPPKGEGGWKAFSDPESYICLHGEQLVSKQDLKVFVLRSCDASFTNEGHLESSFT